MKIGKYIFATLFMFSYAVAFSKDIHSVVISNGLVDVTTPTGKRQVISASGATSQSDAKFIDLTFNGCADLLMLRDRGLIKNFTTCIFIQKVEMLTSTISASVAFHV